MFSPALPVINIIRIRFFRVDYECICSEKSKKKTVPFPEIHSEQLGFFVLGEILHYILYRRPDGIDRRRSRTIT